jgi:hypothetical protein
MGQHALSVIKWQDKKTVTTISASHSDETRTVSKTGKNREMPVECVCDYNQHMGGADKKDKLLKMYLVERKRINKWYMKLFRRLLNVLNGKMPNTLTTYRHNIGRNVHPAIQWCYSPNRALASSDLCYTMFYH